MTEILEQPSGLIDLHAHLVPGVDDGPASERDSLTMLQMAESDGISTIVATPHVFSKLNIIREVEMVLQKQEEFLEKIKLYDFKIRVLPGAEVFFTSDLRDIFDRYPHRLTINRSSYFILEFPFDFIFPGIKDFIFNIQLDGWIPIIAHPERNQIIQRNPRVLYDLVKQGALVQVNAGSLLGNFGTDVQATAFQLIQHNLVQVVASDAHSLNHRPPQLSLVYKRLSEINRDMAELLLIEIPRAILNNQDLPDMDAPVDPQKKLKFFDMIFKRKK